MRGSGKLLIGVGGLLVVTGALVGVTIYLMMQPNYDPTRIVVLRAGSIHDDFDASFVEDFAGKIEDRRFEVVVDETPLTSEGDAALAEARERAMAAEAATAVIVRIGVDDERPGVLDGQRLFRTHLTSTIVPVGEGEPVVHQSEFAFEGPSALELANDVQDTWLDTVAVDTVEALYEVPAILAVLRGEDLSTDRMPIVLALREGEPAIELRRERVQAFERDCNVARQQMADLAATEAGVTCVGDPCRPWTAVGLSPDGQTAYVHEHYREPIIGIVPTGRTRWTEPPEAILSVPLSGEAEPRPLLRVGHFYSVATMRGDGTALSAAFFANGTPAVVSLDPATGEWPGRWLLEPRERVLQKIPSPDRAHALVRRRQQGWAVFGDGDPVVMPPFREATLVEFPDGETRVVGVLESDELTVMDLDGAPSDLRLDVEHRVDFLNAHPGRLDLLVREGRQCSVRSFDLAERELSEPVPIPHCVGQATTLPDGRLIGGFPLSSPGDAPGDWEIVLIDPADASATALTRNSEIDEHPHSARLIRVADRPFFDVLRRKLRWGAR